MKLLSFIAGIITGIVGVQLYGIFVKPTLPSEFYTNKGGRITYTPALSSEDWNPNWSEYLEKTYPEFFACFKHTMDRDPDDTQPVRVSE